MENQVNSWRFERKFPLCSTDEEFFRRKLSDSGFFKTFDNRIINNCYYDKSRWECFDANVVGLSERVKLRFRWYNNDLMGGKFEQKIKSDLFNRKKFHSSSVVDPACSWSDILPEKFIEWYPTLINQYRREYFEDAFGNRLTVDSLLRFAMPTMRIQDMPLFIDYHEKVIVEIKYKREDTISNFLLPCVLGKFSKYVTGIKLTQ